MTHDRMLRAILLVVLVVLVLVLLTIGQGQQIRSDIRHYPEQHGSPRQAVQAVEALAARVSRVEVEVAALVAAHRREVR